MNYKIINNTSLQIEELIEFTLELIKELNLLKYIQNIDVNIINDTENNDAPIIYLNRKPIDLVTNVNGSYWTQFIYQFSHEIFHLIVWSNYNNDNLEILKWYEETICEAFSLFFLKISAQEWIRCKLSELDPNFNKKILSYLGDILNQQSDINKLLVCNNISSLKEIDAFAEKCRFWRYNERNYIYQLFISNRNLIYESTLYRNYVNYNTLLIDFSTWISKTPEIKLISKIQFDYR